MQKQSLRLLRFSVVPKYDVIAVPKYDVIVVRACAVGCLVSTRFFFDSRVVKPPCLF